MNIESMPLSELRSLRAGIEQELRRRGSATQRLVRKLEKLATSQGLSLKELIGTAGGSEQILTVSPVGTPIKYRNPDNPAQGWTGHGRNPKWVTDHLANGGTLDTLAVQ